MGLTDVASIQAEYSTSTRHFLLIGFLGMFVGSVVFCYLAMRKKGENVKETITFMMAAVAAGAYYSMWSGYGVTHKVESDGQQRFIFWGRYVDWFITTPLILYDIAMVAEAELGDIILLLGVDVLMVASGFIGASVVHPYKWFWWTLGMFFYGLVIYKFVCFFTKVKETNADMADSFRVLLAITVISWFIYPVVWVLGSEGLAAISLDMEVGAICLADLVAKVGFGIYMLYAVVPSDADNEKAEKTSLV